jgi:MFS transporter, CP family, cyanate transporter
MKKAPQSIIHPSWLVVFAGICAAFHIAKLSSALPALRADLGLTLVQAGFLLSAVQLSSMVLGLFVGLAVDTVGLRRSMLIGLCLLSIASFAGGFATSGDTLLWLRMTEGFGFLLTVMPAPGLIRRTIDPDHLSSRMGWWGTYMPLGSALSLLVGPLCIVYLGWQPWWWILALMTLFAALVLWWGVPTIAPTAGLEFKKYGLD